MKKTFVLGLAVIMTVAASVTAFANVSTSESQNCHHECSHVELASQGECQRCWGSGKCQTCNGRGYLTTLGIGGGTHKCAACNGTGKCFVCNGRGRI